MNLTNVMVSEDSENDLKDDDQVWHSQSFKNFIEQLIRFLKNACGQYDEAQRVGIQLSLALVNESEKVGHTWK